jgi:predicted enzyme related to lactoylglutathione lyase
MIATQNQPDGTPTWIDLGIPDLDQAMSFYGALFGWQFDVGPAEFGRYTTAYLGGRRVAALAPNSDPDATEFWWNVYLATADCDATAAAVRAAGGTVVNPPSDVMDQGRMAIVRDAAGGQFGLWQGRAHIGCEVVNEPNSLVRNDLVTDQPEVARRFYTEVFGFTLDGNPDLPDFDFTFLRRPDGHEVGGIMGLPHGSGTSWSTTFEVDDADAARERALAAGGRAGEVDEMVYGRFAEITDPFGVEFSVIARPSA